MWRRRGGHLMVRRWNLSLLFTAVERLVGESSDSMRLFQKGESSFSRFCPDDERGFG